MTNLMRFFIFFPPSLRGQCWSLSQLHLGDYRRPKILWIWKYLKLLLLVTLGVASYSSLKTGLRLDLHFQEDVLSRRFLRSHQDRSLCPSECILGELWLLLCSQAQQQIESQNKSNFSLQNLVSVNIIFFPHGHEQMYNIPLSLW